MSTASVKELNKSLAAGKLASAYLLHGADEFVKQAKVGRLIEAALQPEERDFNLDTREASDLSAESLESLLGTPPLFAARRVVVLHNVTSLRKNMRQILDKYLQSPAPDLLLIIVEDGLLSKSEKTLPAHCEVVQFDPLEGRYLEKWIEHQAATLGCSIDQDAVALLIQAVGSDTTLLAAELDKLASFRSGEDAIDAAAVEELVGVQRGHSMGDLLDAIAERNLNRAVPLVSEVLMQPRTTAVSVVLGLSTQMLAIGYAQALLQEGTPRNRVYQELYSLLKGGGGVPMRPWGEAVKCWAGAAGKWKKSELDAACDALMRADVALKESRVSSEEQALLSLVLALCAGSAASGSQFKQSG